MPEQQSKRLHIGVLISSLEESCQSKLWRGIEDYARHNNIDVTAYLSTFQQKDGNLQEHYSVVFDAVLANKSLDGLIIFSGFIAEDIGSEDIAKFVAKCGSLPIISLAMSFPNTPSLLVDNRSGTYDAISHLILQHGLKKIAFVKGPEDHEEATARFEGYRSALKDNGIALDTSIVLPGHFSLWGGEEAVETLYDKRDLWVEAFACADDETAIGVVKELSRRGIRVPEDVAVCGFDDEEYAEIITPSLTTVRQPFYKLGETSLIRLVEKLNGAELELVELLPTKAVIRQSCGCVTQFHFEAHIDDEKYDENTFKYRVIEECLPLFHSDIEIDKICNWITDISRKLTNDFNAKEFLDCVDNVLIDFRAYHEDLSVWDKFFFTLLVLLRDETVYSDSYKDFAEAIVQAIQLVNNAAARNEKYKVLKSNEVQWEIRGIAQELVTSFNIATLNENIKSGAKELGIPMVMVFLYNGPCLYSKWKEPEYVTYELGFGVNGDIRPDLQQLLIPTSEITDLIKVERHNGRSSLFYMPLFFVFEQIGIMILGYNPDSPLDLYEAFRINVATALKGADLFQRIEHQSVTDDMTQLYNRRGFITFSLSRLAHLRRSTVESVLFFIDMDGLKKINDTHGHKEGDFAIKTCARLIKESLREEDIVGRMGGDEFTVLASQVSREQTEHIIRRIRSAFKSFNEANNLPYEVNCSVGAHLLEDYSEDAFEFALQKADELLYLEKQKKKKQGLSRE